MKILRRTVKYVLLKAYLLNALRDVMRIRHSLQDQQRAGAISKIGTLQFLLRIRPVLVPRSNLLAHAYAQAYMLRKMKLAYRGEPFFYSPDFYFVQLLPPKDALRAPLGNLPIDTRFLLKHGLHGLYEKIERSRAYSAKNAERKASLAAFEVVCRSLEDYWRGCAAAVKRYGAVREVPAAVQEYFAGQPFAPATTFHGALQSLLLIHAAFWTTGGRLVGLSHLDQILSPWFKQDIRNGLLTEESAYELIKNLLLQLHEDYYFKSSSLAGDTGQAIILSGISSTGDDTTNRLSYLFLKAVAELKLPDPKLIVRVHSKTPEALWKASIECMKAGTGSPLLSNDDKVIPALTAYGYSYEDACQYTTSACWEPLIPGKSADQNNLCTFNCLSPLHRMLAAHSQGEIWKDFSSFKQDYFQALATEVHLHIGEYCRTHYRYSPLLSLFLDDCIERALDCARGGARYSNLGWTTTALGNAVNALLNIEELVYARRSRTLRELFEAISANFAGYEMIRGELIAQKHKYATDSTKAIELSNEILSVIHTQLRPLINGMGGRYRFGVSSPAHIDAAHTFPASLDGRFANEPFMVHISPTYAGRPIAPTETAHFAAQLDYDKAFNGGVFDVVLDHQLLNRNQAQLITFFRSSFKQGIFQAQANFIDLEQLRDARKHPDKYPNLIVRVWGFSGYFRDLPKEYQDLLIHRAEVSRAAGF